jgi:hypothetical protein
MVKLWVSFEVGIIMMKSFGTLTIDWEQIQKMIVSAYKDFSIAKYI